MARRSSNDFKYDGAISFAGENRSIAKSLADKLKAKGLSVFFVEDHIPTLWGKGREEFEKVYSKETKYVIPIISEHYVKKDWTQHEFGTAVREQRERDEEFILAVRVDNSRILGLHDDKVFCSLDDFDLDQIASFFEAKVRARKPASRGSGRKNKGRTAKSPALVLGADEKHVLGIVVAARLPLPVELYKGLFPAINWARTVRSLIRAGLVRESGDTLRASPGGVEAIRADAAASQSSIERWVERLEELKSHPDIALYLASHHVSERRLDEAVCVLADVGDQGLHGPWNDSILKFLSYFTDARITRRMSSGTRIRLYHALAICSSHAGRHEQSIRWFERVREGASRAKDIYWIGQFHLNSGVARFHAGDQKGAATAYRRAVEHGKKHDDPQLAARALGNLAQVHLSNGDSDAAIALVKESMALKEGDEYSSAISSAQLGLIEAERGNFREALAHLGNAEAAFGKLGFTYNQAQSLYNIGNTHGHMGRAANALRAFKKAARLAANDECIDLRLIAIQGAARACQALGRFAEIERLFGDLMADPVAAKHRGCLFSSHLGIGLARLFQEDAGGGQARLDQALKLARQSGEKEWLIQVFSAMALISGDTIERVASPDRLAGFASKEEKRKDWGTSAKLWRLAAEIFARSGRMIEAEKAFSRAAACLGRDGSGAAELVELLLIVFAWRWTSEGYEKAIEALDEAERLAAKHGLHREQVRAIGEKGIASLKLNRPSEALALHKRALRIAKERKLLMEVRISLNDLGQTHRSLGDTQQAIAAFAESERLARDAGEFSEALGTMVNRGLATQEGGDFRASNALLKKCASESERRGCWGEYVLAKEGLGNNAWRQGKLDLAEQRYREAIVAARRRRLSGEEAEVCVNYAHLLKETGRAKRGLRLLERHEKSFERQADKATLHQVLAGLHQEVGDLAGAKLHWAKGKRYAASVGDRDRAAICASNLASVHEQEGDYESAGAEIESALSFEDEAEGQGILLNDLLRVRIACGDDAKIEEAFNRARAVAEKQRLAATIIDVHMQIGHYLWKGDFESKENAFQAYLAAILEAGRPEDPGSYAQVLGHIILTLTDRRHAPSGAEFDRLLDILKSQLPKQTADNAGGLRLVLWPFEVARKLLPLRGDQLRFESEMRRLLRAGM